MIEEGALRRQFDAMYEQDYAPDRAARVTVELLKQDSTWARFRQWAIFNLGGNWL